MSDKRDRPLPCSVRFHGGLEREHKPVFRGEVETASELPSKREPLVHL